VIVYRPAEMRCALPHTTPVNRHTIIIFLLLLAVHNLQAANFDALNPLVENDRREFVDIQRHGAALSDGFFQPFRPRTVERGMGNLMRTRAFVRIQIVFAVLRFRPHIAGLAVAIRAVDQPPEDVLEVLYKDLIPKGTGGL